MNQFSLLATQRFGPLFCTQFLGALNDNIFRTALALFIGYNLAAQTDLNANLLIVLASGIFILPFFLFSATAGQLADKYEKSMLIRRVKLLEIFIMAVGAAGFMLESITLLLSVLFLMGAQSALFGPLKYGILPQHLQINELVGGNGMVQMGTYLAILLGIMTGGLLIAIPERGPFIITLVVIAVAVSGWLISHAIPLAPSAQPTLRIAPNFIAQTWRLVVMIARDRITFIAILGVSWFWFLGATFLALIQSPGYVQEVLGGAEQVATLLLATFSIGIGAGSLLCERFSRGGIELLLVFVGIGGISLCAGDLYMASGQMPPAAGDGVFAALEFLRLWPGQHVLLDLVGIGLFGGLYIVPLYALIQQRADPAERARTIAANNILNALLMVFSALVTMALLAISVSIPQIFLLVALANLVFAVTVIMQLSPLRARLAGLLPG
ncbi:MAG: MFS transporter [Gammaproteobacteria bacterium]